MYKVIKMFYLKILRDTISAQFYIACLQVAYVFATEQGQCYRQGVTALNALYTIYSELLCRSN